MPPVFGKVARPSTVRIRHEGVQVDKLCYFIWSHLGKPSKLFTALQPLNKNVTDVTFCNNKYVLDLCSGGSLELDGKVIRLERAGTNIRVVFVKQLPVELDNNKIGLAFNSFGKVISLEHETRRLDFCKQTVMTGTRVLRIDMEREIPNFLRLGPYEAMCVYRGVKKTCRRCHNVGHMAFECAKYTCANCNVLGHTAAKCTAPCGNCNEIGHQRAQCVKKTWANRMRAAQEPEMVNEVEIDETSMAVDQPELSSSQVSVAAVVPSGNAFPTGATSLADEGEGGPERSVNTATNEENFSEAGNLASTIPVTPTEQVESPGIPSEISEGNLGESGGAVQPAQAFFPEMDSMAVEPSETCDNVTDGATSIAGDFLSISEFPELDSTVVEPSGTRDLVTDGATPIAGEPLSVVEVAGPSSLNREPLRSTSLEVPEFVGRNLSSSSDEEGGVQSISLLEDKGSGANSGPTKEDTGSFKEPTPVIGKGKRRRNAVRTRREARKAWEKEVSKKWEEEGLRVPSRDHFAFWHNLEEPVRIEVEREAFQREKERKLRRFLKSQGRVGALKQIFGDNLASGGTDGLTEGNETEGVFSPDGRYRKESSRMVSMQDYAREGRGETTQNEGTVSEAESCSSVALSALRLTEAGGDLFNSMAMQALRLDQSNKEAKKRNREVSISPEAQSSSPKVTSAKKKAKPNRVYKTVVEEPPQSSSVGSSNNLDLD